MQQGASSRLTIRQTPAGEDTALLHLTGELDLQTIDLLTETLVRLVRHRPYGSYGTYGRYGSYGRRVLLNLSDISYCDRGSLFTLLGICQALRAANLDVTLTGLSPAVRTMINLAGLTRRLPLHPATDPHLRITRTSSGIES